ncbi:MAG: BspA family leucine-rich repeat surface protein, partial [Bacteroidaceae bacterium]|nr:BspA family leucine-rich repeat surface protein [Bacteroidaceae bacterium]
LNVSSFDTGKVKDMKSMFSYCKALMSLDVSNFDTGKVKDMSNMFSYCEALEELDLDNFDTEEVTDMSFMFNGCSVLTSLDLSSFNTENVTSMGSMFASCKNLPMLDVSSFNVESVTNMSAMFMNCESLTTIFCLDDWKEMCEAEDLNSSYMFSGCSVLKGVVPYNRNNSNDVDFANPTTGYFAPFYDLTVTEAGMATLYLGFQAEIPEDVNAYLCYAEDLEEDNPYALAHKFEDSYLPKETAVFVTAEPGTYRFKYYYVEPGYVINFISDFLDGNILTGPLEEMPVEPHSVLTLGYSNQTDDLGFWWYTGTTIPANRAYIPGDKLPAEVKGIRLLFDEETGIKTTNLMNQTNEADAWYTIDGRKLEGKPQQRGLYINNGKKIMVK